MAGAVGWGGVQMQESKGHGRWGNTSPAATIVACKKERESFLHRFCCQDRIPSKG